MPVDLKTDDEEGRLRALERLEILDTPEEAPFEKIVSLVQQVLRVPMCAVSLVANDRQCFKARHGLAVSGTSRDVSFCTHTIQHREPLIVENASNDPRFAANPSVAGEPFIRSYAGVPLTTPDGYNVGSLCAIDTEPRAFSASEIAILENFAKLVVDTFELRQIASTDHLTGALARGAWSERAKVELHRAQRHGRPLSLALLDIDSFKAINDSFGHPAGDGVIRALAELCLASMRGSDLFGRLGGEEFGLLMPETPIDGASLAAERIRTDFAGQSIDLGRPVNVTVSIGVAALPPHEHDLEALIARADQALYAAKRGGRNRVVVGPPPAIAAHPA